MAASVQPIPEPFPIFQAGLHYFLHDVDTIAYVRRKHNMCGVLIGTIPYMSQQNIFLGAPLELMPEEARLLVEKGYAYVVDDATAHMNGFLNMADEERQVFEQIMAEQGREAARAQQVKAKARTEKALQGLSVKAKAKAATAASTAEADEVKDAEEQEEDESLFSASQVPAVKRTTTAAVVTEGEPDIVYGITPATSFPPLVNQPPVAAAPSQVPKETLSYPLFRFLQSKGYFMTPGLRFGCNFTVYPGDPLRFHSHFLAVGLGWDQEIDLLDIVGGGRLGTGVKKGYLFGGEDASKEAGAFEVDADPPVRIFCVEWAQM